MISKSKNTENKAFIHSEQAQDIPLTQELIYRDTCKVGNLFLYALFFDLLDQDHGSDSNTQNNRKTKKVCQLLLKSIINKLLLKASPNLRDLGLSEIIDHKTIFDEIKKHEAIYFEAILNNAKNIVRELIDENAYFKGLSEWNVSYNPLAATADVISVLSNSSLCSAITSMDSELNALFTQCLEKFCVKTGSIVDYLQQLENHAFLQNVIYVLWIKNNLLAHSEEFVYACGVPRISKCITKFDVLEKTLTFKEPSNDVEKSLVQEISTLLEHIRRQTRTQND